jgi:uncharacterized protein YndB with AHSA1/START domain
MQMSPMFRHLAAVSVMVAAAQGVAGSASATSLIGLTAEDTLVRIDGEAGRAAAPVRITGADGRVLGIDQRPQDGKLYGVTERGQIVTIDPANGRATQVSRLSMPFESGGRAVVDFNPAANRLRLMGMNGTNFRVNVETGEVVRDGDLKYQDGSPQAATTPRITAGAYTNSATGQTTTTLYTIDSLLGAYNLQAPPNDGVQQVKGMFGMSVPASLGFDILTDGNGGNMGFVFTGDTLHGIDLANGKLTTSAKLSGLPAAEVIDIAATR